MHYQTAAATVLALLGAAQAAPAQQRTAATSTSQGVRLRLDSSSTTSTTTPLYLTYQRISQGVNIAVAGSTGPVFYQNGADAATSTVVTDIPGVYPLGLSVQGSKQFDPTFPREHNVGVNVNGVTTGLSLSSGSLSAPAGSGIGGVYMICERQLLVGGPAPSKLQVIRIRYAGEAVPQGCKDVKVVAECAVLAELPGGSSWDHDDAVEVKCTN